MPGIKAVIFDLDGVLVDTPQHAAWSAAVADVGCGGAELLTAATYQREVAGRGRAESARAILRLIGRAGDEALAQRLAVRKQVHFERLVAADALRVYPDAVDYALAWRRVALAAASASRSAGMLLARVGRPPDVIRLADLFPVCLSGTRPDKAGLFAQAAQSLGVTGPDCLVVEDAPTGVAGGVSIGATVVGIARRAEDIGPLTDAGAAVVVTDLADAPRPT